MLKSYSNRLLKLPFDGNSETATTINGFQNKSHRSLLPRRIAVLQILRSRSFRIMASFRLVSHSFWSQQANLVPPVKRKGSDQAESQDF
jgi:hypothetical protein